MKIAIINLGCPKALTDSENIVTLLLQNGCMMTKNLKEADFIIVNTCGFIKEARRESLASIAMALDNSVSKKNVIVTGCLGSDPDFIRQKYPEVLAIIPPHRETDVLKVIIDNSAFIKQPNYHLDFTKITKMTPRHFAYLKISEGCNHRCRFCIIPFLRGPLQSRSIDDIYLEAKALSDCKVKELILIAQDTLAYGIDFGKTGYFLNLLEKLAQLPLKIRLHYLYPYKILDAIIPFIQNGNVLPYFDVPLQHVNSRILKLMNRPAFAEENILERLSFWRKEVPGLTIRSTFIVGFPTETDEEFTDLLNFLEKAKLDKVGAFKFSPVSGAEASRLEGQIPYKIKQERFNAFMKTQQKISLELQKAKLGQEMAVIIDDENDEYFIGRTAGDSPDIDGKVYIKKANNSYRIGDVAHVIPNAYSEYDLFQL